MAIYQVPKYAGGQFHVRKSYAGTPMVWNGKTGKNKLVIPCRDRKQAEEVCQKLNTGDHNGAMRI